jgi:hypothetical protein
VKWLISIRGTVRVTVNGELHAAHTVLGELIFETIKLGDGVTWTPTMSFAIDEVFFNDEKCVSAKFYPPRRMVIEPGHIVAMIEQPDATVRSTR